MENWDKKKERGNIFALKVAIFIYKLLGKKSVSILLYPVVSYFYLTDSTGRRASFNYLKFLSSHSGETVSRFKLLRISYRHYLSFGRKIVHSLSAWLGEFRMNEIEFIGREIVYSMADRREGGLVLGAHVGCLEVCRAAKKENEKVKIVPLMYIENGLKFRGFLKELDPKSEEEVIMIEEGKLDLPMQIFSRIKRGEFVSILADRLSPFAGDRNIEINFLGRLAKFPEGPFAMAYALNCPVLTFFSIYDENTKRYKAYWEPLDISDLERAKSKRAENLKIIAERYAKRLEDIVHKYPTQWFNFFDFWA